MALMNFGQALEVLKNGQRAKRDGWGRARLWIELTPHDRIDMRSASHGWVPRWRPTQADMLANDWRVIK